MAQQVLINGTNYQVGGGKPLVNGTSYSITGGKTKVAGTDYEIGFKKKYTITTDLTNSYIIDPVTDAPKDFRSWVTVNGAANPGYAYDGDIVKTGASLIDYSISGGQDKPVYVYVNGQYQGAPPYSFAIHGDVSIKARPSTYWESGAINITM